MTGLIISGEDADEAARTIREVSKNLKERPLLLKVASLMVML